MSRRRRKEGGGGGERLIKDLKRKANSLSRDTRQANAVGLGAPVINTHTKGILGEEEESV